MDTWLAEHLDNLTLSLEAEEYLLGRGVGEEWITKLGFKTWSPATTPAPDKNLFQERYQACGQGLTGWLVIPIYCPRGLLLGFEARRFPEKQITRYLLKRADWNPVWHGIAQAMPKLWEGKSPLIFEGYFDVEVVRQVLPHEPVLGSFRAKLTDKHVEFLRRILPRDTEVRLGFDRDETGKKGIKKAAYALGQAGVALKPIIFSKGKDPNEIWEKYGFAGLREELHL